MLKPEHVAEIVDQHDAYWDDRRPRMRELRSMYFTRFWSDREYDANDGVLRTEVPKAYAVVESYLGSLYARNPSVFVQPDLRARGNPEVAAATANQYLLTVPTSSKTRPGSRSSIRAASSSWRRSSRSTLSSVSRPPPSSPGRSSLTTRRALGNISAGSDTATCYRWTKRPYASTRLPKTSRRARIRAGLIRAASRNPATCKAKASSASGYGLSRFTTW